MKYLRCFLLILFTISFYLVPAQEYQTKELNGMTMAYRVMGEGEPLVLLHGFSGSGESAWRDIPEALTDTYQVIVPDLRGHGRSTNPSGTFTHRQSALDVYALLDALGINTFNAMGISTGGMTLLHMATTQRDRVKAMVLIGATSYFPDQAREVMVQMNPETMSEQRVQAMASRHSRGEEQVRALMQQFYDFRNSYDDMNFTPPFLGSITARTLIIHGDRDVFFPVDIPVMEYESIPESYLWIVPNGGHVPLISNKTEREFMLYKVKQFLAGDWGED